MVGFGISCIYNQKDYFKRALKCLNKCLQLDPTSTKTLSNKGMCLAKFGLLEKALSNGLDMALAIDPNDLFVLDKKARVLWAAKEYSKVIDVCDKILTLTNNADDKILQLKADELNKHGEYEKSIVIYDQFLALKPNDPYILDKKAAALSDLNKKDESVIIYNQILQTDPKNILTLLNKGAILYQQNLFERAITTCYDVVLDLNNTNAIALAGKGYCLAMQGKYHQAIEYFENSLSTEPDNLTALTGKASCLLDLGQFEKAIKTLKISLRIGINSDFQLDLKNLYNFKSDHYTSLYLLSAAYSKLKNYTKAWEYWYKHLKVLMLKQQIDNKNPESKVLVAMAWF